ncbi:hypothetical protein WMY93_002954 [Mugilogobius chulae]|uniref:PEHE domain-containing protein n=1 Tax=Mugilogobius chulae TaxID=88201 RepID=A0AAW0PWV3_9GOBI
MAPALTKLLKDGHGVHLLSPLASNKHSSYSVDLDSQLRPSEDIQKMIFSVLPSLESCLDLPSNAGVTTNQSDSWRGYRDWVWTWEDFHWQRASSTLLGRKARLSSQRLKSSVSAAMRCWRVCRKPWIRGHSQLSSDDEPEHTKKPSEYRAPSVASPCFEKRWLKERAELGSRWSWLQLRVTELEGRIRQLTKLHKNICSAKGCVVLENVQPMTERQMKNALLREMSGFPGALLDTDNEACSPTRLLHNIERQSAHLSMIVNSLMPPLNLSPLSKSSQTWGNKRAFNSDVFVSGSSKRRKFSVQRRQLFKDDMSCVCARTRALVTYHKPRLFRPSSICKTSSFKCSSSLSGLESCSCSGLCELDSSSNGTLSSRTCSFNSGDSTLVFSRFTKGSGREEWSQIPLVVNALPLSPVYYKRRSSTPLYNSRKYTQHYKNKVLELSPIQQHGCLQRKRRVHQRKRKRRHRHFVTEDDDEDSYWEDSSDEMENYVLVSQKQSTKGVVHRRHGESVFNIDNIVIPASLTKVEKLQYKDILTPSWDVVDIQTLLENEVDSEKGKDNQIENLTDQVFAERHLPLEQKEKLRWSFWGKRHCRHTSRSGSRMSSCDGVLEENSVVWTQLDSDDQLSTEECLPQAPWDRRVFPLTEDDEQELSSELQGCSTCPLSSSTNLNSDLITFQSTDTTPPPSGYHMNSTNDEH